MPESKTYKNKQKLHGRRKTFKKLNCSPFVAGKQIAEESCITPDIALKIKEEYNKFHSAQPISSSEPNQILEELHQRLPTCTSEECFIGQIGDDRLKEQIKDALFSPKQPSSWRKNKREWVSNFDMEDVLKQYEDTYPNFKFIGATYMDFDHKLKNGSCVEEDFCKFDLNEEMKRGKTKFGFVFNLAKHGKPGIHWNSMFVDTDEKLIFFLDSAGDPAPKEVRALVKRIRKQAPFKFRFIQNAPVEHQYGSSECGMYALYFIITMLTGKTSGGAPLDCAKSKIKYFKKDRIPDKHVAELRDKYFNR
jgi:hypothetical protein